MSYRRKPKHARITFEDNDYEGLEVTVDLNRPMGDLLIFDEIKNLDDVREMYQILSKIVVSWNVEDEDGKPVPCTPDGLRSEVTYDLLKVILGKWRETATMPSAPLGSS